MNHIDLTYDFRTDAGGRDPDKYSATLRSYHKKLWNKQLPNGKILHLTDEKPNTYLYHHSDLGEHFLSSDSIIHSYATWTRMQHIIKQVPKDDITGFLNLAYTIGGFIIFPANKVDNYSTINQERGCNAKIRDRFDLTLECIRLYYLDEESPLKKTLDRYTSYFKLFGDFQGYCEFFLLQDLVMNDFTQVKFFLPFKGFITNPVPQSVDEYHTYKENNISFLLNRNKRIGMYDKRN